MAALFYESLKHLPQAGDAAAAARGLADWAEQVARRDDTAVADAAAALGIKNQEYVRCISRRGDAVVMAMCTHRVPRDMVFIPFHFFDCVNRLTLGLLDPHSRQPAFKQSAVGIEPIADQVGAARVSRERRAY